MAAATSWTRMLRLCPRPVLQRTSKAPTMAEAARRYVASAASGMHQAAERLVGHLRPLPARVRAARRELAHGAGDQARVGLQPGPGILGHLADHHVRPVRGQDAPGELPRNAV